MRLWGCTRPRILRLPAPYSCSVVPTRGHLLSTGGVLPPCSTANHLVCPGFYSSLLHFSPPLYSGKWSFNSQFSHLYNLEQPWGNLYNLEQIISVFWAPGVHFWKDCSRSSSTVKLSGYKIIIWFLNFPPNFFLYKHETRMTCIIKQFSYLMLIIYLNTYFQRHPQK